MIKTMVNLPELNILYVRDLIVPIPNQRIDLYIQEELDSTYNIYQLPYNYFGYHSDFHNRFAYSFDHISLDNQKKYQEKCRHMIQNKNGSYYEDSKKYVYKKTEF